MIVHWTPGQLEIVILLTNVNFWLTWTIWRVFNSTIQSSPLFEDCLYSLKVDIYYDKPRRLIENEKPGTMKDSRDILSRDQTKEARYVIGVICNAAETVFIGTTATVFEADPLIESRVNFMCIDPDYRQRWPFWYWSPPAFQVFLVIHLKSLPWSGRCGWWSTGRLWSVHARCTWINPSPPPLLQSKYPTPIPPHLFGSGFYSLQADFFVAPSTRLCFSTCFGLNILLASLHWQSIMLSRNLFDSVWFPYWQVPKETKWNLGALFLF